MRVNKRVVPIVVGVAILGAGAYALFGRESEPAAAVVSPALVSAGDLPSAPTFDTSQLPPNHPPIGPHGGVGPAVAPEPPSLSWTAPAAWQEAPSPNAMRLATYRVPGGAELAVSRAGGTVDANVARWTSQFDDGARTKRSTKKVRGMDVTVVEITGTYSGSSMNPNEAAAPHADWALLAAIVTAPSGAPYFFKLLGPAAAVRDARASFDGLVDGLSPRQP